MSKWAMKHLEKYPPDIFEGQNAEKSSMKIRDNLTAKFVDELRIMSKVIFPMSSQKGLDFLLWFIRFFSELFSKFLLYLLKK